MWLVRRRRCNLQVVLLGFPGTLSDGSWNVRRELGLQDHIVMQVVFEIFSAFASSMSIVDTKDLQLWPLVSGYPWIFCLRLNDVQDNRDPIFVCLAHSADICIRCKGLDRAESFGANLACLEEW